MSEPVEVKDAAAHIAPRKVESDRHGTIYTWICPHCGRGQSVREGGEQRCGCGQRIILET